MSAVDHHFIYILLSTHLCTFVCLIALFEYLFHYQNIADHTVQRKTFKQFMTLAGRKYIILFQRFDVCCDS